MTIKKRAPIALNVSIPKAYQQQKMFSKKPSHTKSSKNKYEIIVSGGKITRITKNIYLAGNKFDAFNSLFVDMNAAQHSEIANHLKISHTVNCTGLSTLALKPYQYILDLPMINNLDFDLATSIKEAIEFIEDSH
jgi:hypothetical protein